MPLPVDDELRELCGEIVAWMSNEPEWRDIEASDMFQSEHYCGGWEGEDEFTFNYYDDENRELWFTLSPMEVEDVAKGRRSTVETREPT